MRISSVVMGGLSQMSLELRYNGFPLIMKVVSDRYVLHCPSGKGLILGRRVETLSYRLGESFHDAILMACVRYCLLPFEITTEILI